MLINEQKMEILQLVGWGLLQRTGLPTPPHPECLLPSPRNWNGEGQGQSVNGVSVEDNQRIPQKEARSSRLRMGRPASQAQLGFLQVT